jgi:hypothetical protein
MSRRPPPSPLCEGMDRGARAAERRRRGAVAYPAGAADDVRRGAGSRSHARRGAGDAGADEHDAYQRRQHVANAIGYGATAAELMEVFELASGIGVESFALALPAPAEAMETEG